MATATAMSTARRATLTALALAGLAFTGLSTPAATAAEAPAAPPLQGTVVIRTATDPGMVVDLDHGSPATGAPVLVYPDHDGANQKWQVVPIAGEWFQLKNVASGSCLVNIRHSQEDGHQLAGAPCTAAYEDTRWTSVPTGKGEEVALVNNNNGKCMDQTGAAHNEHPTLEQWACRGDARQHWIITSTGTS
ncbi:RICIN domain-containing protein [Streptomyces sp. NPDC016845]|uniref:RICIN domain-containing protein n=1 Tax=Streptomyces sp. NPDC016845 TaxID=3364972 RepID=UPI0037BCC7C8